MTLMRTYVRLMPDYSYTVTEHDPDRPWIVRGTSHGKVTLDDDVQFFRWANENWPAPRWSVDLDPYQLSAGWQRHSE